MQVPGAFSSLEMDDVACKMSAKRFYV